MENENKKMGHYVSKNMKEEIRPIVFTSQHLNKKIVVSDFKYRLVNENTNMLNAKVKVGDDFETYICLNIPERLDFYKMIKMEVFQALDKLDKYDNLKEEQYNHLGTIDVRTTKTKILKKEQKQYYITSPTKSQLQYVKEHLDTQLPKKPTEEVKQPIIEEKPKSAESEFRDKLKNEFEEFVEGPYDEKDESIINATLKVKNIKVEKIDEDNYEKYMYYEGTDLQSGKTLEINKAHYKKVDGKYIYTAYVNRPSEQKEEDKKPNDGRPEGYPVMFELPKNINEAIKEDDILPILRIVKKQKDVEMKNNSVNFLGRVTHQGDVERNMVSTKNISNEILEEVKQGFISEVKRRRQEREMEQEEMMKFEQEQNAKDADKTIE